MEQGKREDAPAAPSTFTALALWDFFLLSLCLSLSPGPASLETSGSSHLCCSLEGIYRLQMCHPGSFPDSINLPVLVSARMTWPLTHLSLQIFTLGQTPLQGLQGQGGLPCARSGVRVCLWGSCFCDSLGLPRLEGSTGRGDAVGPMPVSLCLWGGPHRVTVGCLHFLPSTTDRHFWGTQL